MLEMYRRDTFREDLLADRCNELLGLDARMHELDEMLAAARAGRSPPAAASAERRSRGARTSVRTAAARPASGQSSPAPSAAIRSPPTRTSAPIAARPRRKRATRRSSPRPMPAPPEACLTCGAAVEPGQEYCLECGARVVPARRFSAVGRAWERRWGRYPGDWMWAALLLGLVAAGSATAGIVASRDTGTASGTRTLIATSPIVPAPPTPPPPTTTTTPTRTSATDPTPTPKRRERPRPPGRPRRLHGRARLDPGPRLGACRSDRKGEGGALERLARRRRARLLEIREPPPGYYVVFAGIYDSLDEAQTAARGLSGRYPNAYARQVTR